MFKSLFKKLILSVVFCSGPLNAHYTYGHASLQGRRPTMEDTYFAKEAESHAFYGVFDGHGGVEVARHLALKLYFNIVSCSYFKASPLRAMAAGCLLTNQDLLSFAENQGSCAIMALIKDDRLFIGNVGDSRAVLCRAGVAHALSQDHKPTRPDERKRIQDLGGFITMRGGVARVQGVLAITRAFGDFKLKPYVIAQPETLTHQIVREDEFLVLACDGVWDVFTNQQAVDLVRVSLQKSQDPKLAAQALAQAAYDAGSMDNISVLVVKLSKFCC